MKPTPHPSTRAKVVVFLDANMPNVRSCRRGCSSDATRMCVHRFGPCLWVCPRPARASRPSAMAGELPILFSRFRDLEVIQHWVAHARAKWGDPKGRIRRKKFLLVTHDCGFISDARSQYGSGRNASEPLQFSAGKVQWRDREHIKHGWVRSGSGRSTVHINVLFLMPDGHPRDRTRDLQTTLEYARELRVSDAP